jgi:flagellar basal body-associated protein FliL
MDTLIKLTQSLTEEFGALAWVVLGVVLPVLIVVGVITLYWVSHGGLRCQRTKLFAKKHECAERPKEG